jgi:hypothetical protein
MEDLSTRGGETLGNGKEREGGKGSRLVYERSLPSLQTTNYLRIANKRISLINGISDGVLILRVPIG